MDPHGWLAGAGSTLAKVVAAIKKRWDLQKWENQMKSGQVALAKREAELAVLAEVDSELSIERRFQWTPADVRTERILATEPAISGHLYMDLRLSAELEWQNETLQLDQTVHAEAHLHPREAQRNASSPL